MGLGDIPKKRKEFLEEERFTFSFTLNANDTVKFARVKEVLGNYSNKELLEKLVQLANEEYFDGIMPKNSSLPKNLTIQKYIQEVNNAIDK